jgi:Na+/melibiose symporter-like transporter
MITKTALRSYVSPAVVFTFVVVSVTGFLMLFDFDSVDDLHKWMGLSFGIVGIIHLVVNWRTLVVYFRGRKIMIWGLAMLIVCAVLLFGIGDSDRDIDDDRKSEGMENISRDLHDE